jgi:hypothetical protein
MWEYEFKYLCHRGSDEKVPGFETKTYTHQDIESQLNDLARQGWELIYFPNELLQGDHVEGHGLFRREKGFVDVVGGYQAMVALECYARRTLTWDELEIALSYTEKLELSAEQLKKIIRKARDENERFSFEKFTSLLRSIGNYKEFLNEP